MVRANMSIDKIKIALDEFVNNGGKVSDLGVKDELYQFVSQTRVYTYNGDGTKRKLNVEEKFALAGHPRKPKAVKNVYTALVMEIEAWLKAGNDFHHQRIDMPFYQRLKRIARKETEETGEHVLPEDVMHRLGYKNYSNIYFRYHKIMDLEKYKDDQGYVDSYVNDPEMKNYLFGCEQNLNMPTPVIIGLVANQKLKTYTVSVDYLKQVKKSLEEYIEKYGTLVNISRTNPTLYRQIGNIKKRLYKEDATSFSSLDVLEILEIDAENLFTDAPIKSVGSIDKLMFKLREKAKANGGMIKKNDIAHADYVKILQKSYELGCYVSDIFSAYSINYQDQRDAKRLNSMRVKEYPCMKEMRELRDEIVGRAIKANGNMCKEERFEVYLQACILAYEKYKNQTNNFEDDDEPEV